jgi:hypothetical protein
MEVSQRLLQPRQLQHGHICDIYAMPAADTSPRPCTCCRHPTPHSTHTETKAHPPPTPLRLRHLLSEPIYRLRHIIAHSRSVQCILAVHDGRPRRLSLRAAAQPQQLRGGSRPYRAPRGRTNALIEAAVAAPRPFSSHAPLALHPSNSAPALRAARPMTPRSIGRVT